uniref:Uncharacterized protein n=1 Tax=Rhodnius prolixus TaxID=13249 RepID=T1HBL9_RHOPR
MQVYDSADRNEPVNVLVNLGIPKKFVRLIRMILNNSKCKDKIHGRLSENFAVDGGLRQEDSMSPILFNLELETAVRAIRINPNGAILNRFTQHLA